MSAARIETIIRDGKWEGRFSYMDEFGEVIQLTFPAIEGCSIERSLDVYVHRREADYDAIRRASKSVAA